MSASRQDRESILPSVAALPCELIEFRSRTAISSALVLRAYARRVAREAAHTRRVSAALRRQARMRTLYNRDSGPHTSAG
jgi:hypothetical protein